VIQSVTLLDGRILPVQDIQLEPDQWNFTRISTGERLTYDMRQQDKRQFPNFDVVKSNDEIYKEVNQETSNPGSTNVTSLFIQQLATDPLAAPADAVASVVDRVDKITSSPTFIIVGGLVVVGLAIFILSRYVPKP
jgi:hypothetical protein